ncbi:MAG: TonB-dependent receptor domain-containing protein [Gemmatimonadaceae bacterium]
MPNVVSTSPHHFSARYFRFSTLRFGGLSLGLASIAFATSLHAQTGTVSGRVTEAETSQPIADVFIRIAGTQQVTVSRSDGSYRLQVSPGSYSLRANRIGYGTVSHAIVVSAGQTVTQDFSLVRAPINLDQVVVTGSRALDRSVLEAPVPIDVLSAADIRQTGLTETSQVIQMLAPSLNFPRPSVNDGTDHIRPATLRGLGPDQTLVLINGKRRHTTALVHVNQSVGRGSTSVDLNAIPVSAIERIEILRDGAAAQYGSDAIAGVINVILKSGEQTSLSATAGQVRSKPDGADVTYDDGEVVQADANFGRAIRTDGFFHLSGEFRNRGRTNRARVDTSQQCLTGDTRCTNVPAGANIYDEKLRQSWQGDSESRDWSLFLNSEIPFESATRMYGFGGFSMRDGLAAGFLRRSRDDRVVRDLAPNGLLPHIASDIRDVAGTVGFRGNLRDWGWDLSAGYGGNSFEFTVDRSLNTSMGLASPTKFNAGTLRSNQAAANLDFVRRFPETFAGPLNVAVGAELRREGYKIERGDENSYRVGDQRILDGPNAGKPAAPFAQVFPGFRPEDEADESRTNVGGYLDIEATPIEQLLLAVAGRVENYSDFGSTADGKMAARLELFPGVAVRGAAQTGFRAPSLAQSNFSAVSTNFINVAGVSTPFEIRTFAVGSQGGELLGAKALEPERSVNLSGGLTLRPIANLSLSADYYHITIDDRIVLSGNFIHDSVRALLERNGIVGVSGARYFTNAIDTRTKGLDVVFNYGLDLESAGLVRFTAGYNQNKTEVIRVSETPPQLAAVSTALFDRVQRNLFERGQPKDNLSLTLNHALGNFTWNAHAQRFGEFRVFQPATTGAQDQTFSAKWVTDLSLSYRFLDQLTLAVGANNIFDVYPDTVITANQTRGIYLYAGASPFGFNGRYLYVRAAYDFTALRSPFRKERQTR